jgi:hypothetical protein
LVAVSGWTRTAAYRSTRTAPSLSNVVCGAFAFVFYYSSFSASSPSHFSDGITRTNVWSLPWGWCGIQVDQFGHIELCRYFRLRSTDSLTSFRGRFSRCSTFALIHVNTRFGFQPDPRFRYINTKTTRELRSSVNTMHSAECTRCSSILLTLLGSRFLGYDGCLRKARADSSSDAIQAR